MEGRASPTNTQLRSSIMLAQTPSKSARWDRWHDNNFNFKITTRFFATARWWWFWCFVIWGKGVTNISTAMRRWKTVITSLSPAMFLDTMIVRRYYGNLTHIAGNPQHLHDFQTSQAAKFNKHGHLLDETTQLSISKKSNPNVNFRMLQKAARSRMLLPQHGKETFHDVVCLIYQPLVRIPLLEFFHTT